jgi:putative DNA primase/helicase
VARKREHIRRCCGLAWLPEVDSPGSRKSPAAVLAYKPLEKLQAALRKAHKQELEIFERDMRDHVVKKKRAAKEDKPEPDPPVRPKMRRCIVDDITVEALATRLEQNPRGFLSAHDELTGFLKGLDQYKSGGKGNARQSYLKMWSNNAIYVDRKGADEPVVVPNPYVTLQGAIQPSVLGEIGAGRDDGFLDRFIFAYPEPHRGGYSEDIISAQAELTYYKVIGDLWDR